MKKSKIKIHRHRWMMEYEDCSRCGGGEIMVCGCGDTKEPTTKDFKIKVVKKK